MMMMEERLCVFTHNVIRESESKSKCFALQINGCDLCRFLDWSKIRESAWTRYSSEEKSSEGLF
jgi:hypothetical protein